MNKKLVLVFWAMAAITCMAMPAWAASVPEEAQRHFDRGLAAVEMAQTPEDYNLAIGEFEKAMITAPEWPDIYYNLGLIQERAGRYRDAASSLRRYLQLAPDSADAAEIRTLANKAEFKAEQVLTDDEVLDIIISLTDNSQWQLKGIIKADLFSKERWIRSIERVGEGSLRYVSPSGFCGENGLLDQKAMLSGKSIEFGTIYCTCKISTDPESCAEGRRYFLEVISRNKVAMRLRYWYPQIMGGGTDDATFEFVRR